MRCFADGVPVPMDYRSGYPIVCCPPKDAIELGERVWTFWGAVRQSTSATFSLLDIRR